MITDFLEIRDYDRAKTVCHQLARLQPHDATVRYRLFELALLTHNFRDPSTSLAELDRVLGEIDDIAGQGPLWYYGKAVRLRLEAGQGKPELYDKAMECAVEAQRQRVSWSRPHVLQGEICRARGDEELALQHYLQASILGDHDLDFIRLLLQMLFQRQRYQEAEQVIHRLDSEQVVVTAAIVKQEAQILAIWGDFDMALECALKAYDPNSSDYGDHLWQGQVLRILARRAQVEDHPEKLGEILGRAEAALRRAIERRAQRARLPRGAGAIADDRQ